MCPEGESGTRSCGGSWSRGRASGTAIVSMPDTFGRSSTSSGSSAAWTWRTTSSSCGTLSGSRTGGGSWCRAGDQPPTRRCVTASGLPPWTPSGWTCCSSGSSRSPATSRLTLTSTLRTGTGRKCFSTCTRNTAVGMRPWCASPSRTGGRWRPGMRPGRWGIPPRRVIACLSRWIAAGPWTRPAGWRREVPCGPDSIPPILGPQPSSGPWPDWKTSPVTARFTWAGS